MTEQEYRAHPGVNKSTLWEIRKSPAHYKWALENPGEDTPALKYGRAVHMAVLQSDEFDENYAVIPDGIDRRTKEGKAAWAAFTEEAEGKELLTADELTEVMAAAKSVVERTGPLWAWDKEVPLFWTDDRTGIECKCRVDAMKEEEDKFIVFDLKTTADAETDAFTRNAIRYGYHVQAAHYVNGVVANGLNHGKPVEWHFVVVEKKPPYAVNYIITGDDFMSEGQKKLATLMDTLKNCRDLDVWPGYGTNTLVMPRWAIDEEDE